MSSGSARKSTINAWLASIRRQVVCSSQHHFELQGATIAGRTKGVKVNVFSPAQQKAFLDHMAGKPDQE
jgi:hypothetical protein